MNPDRYIISLWPLTTDGQFFDTAPAWESETIELPEAEAAYKELTHAVAWAIVGQFHEAFNVSLDVLDRDGIGICKEIRLLQYQPVPA